METAVVIVGAGPSGLATAACLGARSIPYVILERDDCIASLWRHRSYDRLTLHLAKQFCQLPYAPHPTSTPTYIPKRHFIEYLDDYARRFAIQPRFNRTVESARLLPVQGTWSVRARDSKSGAVEEYVARFLVVASGENDEAFVPEIDGLDQFGGEVVHSSRYRSGSVYAGKSVLVVGSGNSGMEIAYDLCCSGARASIVVRSPMHVVSKEIWYFGMLLMKFLPRWVLDHVILFLLYLKFGDLSRYGLHRPNKGPFHLKYNTPLYPIVDTGTVSKIKSGEIQVLPSVSWMKDNSVIFVDGKIHQFDAIILATGYKSKIKGWLKDDDFLIGDDGMAKQKFPNHWKGKNGLYLAGLVRRGIYGCGEDAQSIADDIHAILQNE